MIDVLFFKKISTISGGFKMSPIEAAHTTQIKFPELPSYSISVCACSGKRDHSVKNNAENLNF